MQEDAEGECANAQGEGTCVERENALKVTVHGRTVCERMSLGAPRRDRDPRERANTNTG